MDGREKLPEKLPCCVVPSWGRLVPTTLLIELMYLFNLWTSGMLSGARDASSLSWCVRDHKRHSEM